MGGKLRLLSAFVRLVLALVWVVGKLNRCVLECVELIYYDVAF